MTTWEITYINGTEIVVLSSGAISRNGKPLVPRDNGLGYLRVALKGKQYCVHCIIAATFLGPKPDGYEIDHVDGNKQNNALDNLEYVSRSENTKRFWSRSGIDRAGGRGKTKLSAQYVNDIRKLFASGISKNEIARMHNVTHGCIRHIISGKNHSQTK